MTEALFHIVDRSVWARAAAAGEYRPPSLAEEGFVHFSFAGQVAATANARYRHADDLCVVEIDPSRVPHDVRVEDSYGSGTEFPHVYGPIPVAAAVAVHELRRDARGEYVFSPAGPAGHASPDH
jgi:uncharacterized protein (DUF952 family)